ncbi:MAG: hypothetical protein ACHRXM_00075 [Isosphaerales bacterium]
MTITLSLAPETERKLHEHTAANGQTVEGFIRGLLEEVVGDDGTHSATLPQRSRPLDEILEPVRCEFEESGMTEEELTRFLSQVRDEVRREKRARKVP